VVVSKCLLSAPCRYDGVVISCPAVGRLKSRVRFIPVCPETAIGLGVPRAPIRLVSNQVQLWLVQPATGRRLTRKMAAFSRRFLASLPAVDGFILKARSPSCGIRDVAVLRRSSKTRGSGFFARAARKHFPGAPIENEQALANPARRRRFLERVAARATGHKGKRLTYGGSRL
jgi:uncharacterized protein YbbK (DUF523 family)